MATSSPEIVNRFEPVTISSTPGRDSSNNDRNSSTGPSSPTTRSRATSASNSSYLRNTARRFSTSGMPLGFFQASGQVVSSAPSLRDIQTGNLDKDGWSGVGQRRNSVAWKESDGQVLENMALERTQTGLSVKRRYSVAKPIPEEAEKVRTTDSSTARDKEKSAEVKNEDRVGAADAHKEAVPGEKTVSEEGGESSIGKADVIVPHDPKVPYPNGYQFPPKHTKTQSLKIGLRAYWRFLWTPFGFLLTVYALNIVAWGGMLFLVLIGGAPAMCHPEVIRCSDKDSTKNVWIENDSQIVNALFCVTGLGLIPWRFRDLYYLLQYRWGKNVMGLRRLAGINRDWFRLPESQSLDIHWDPKTTAPPPGFDEITFADPVEKSPDPPLTGERAPATKIWKLDFYIWCYVWNTFFQIMLCGCMWGLNRHTRPAWTTGCLIPVACIVAAAGGIVTGKEGKKVKSIEGVPVSEEDLEILRVMRQKELEASGGEEGVPQFRDPAPAQAGNEKGKRSTEEGPNGEST